MLIVPAEVKEVAAARIGGKSSENDGVESNPQQDEACAVARDNEDEITAMIGTLEINDENQPDGQTTNNTMTVHSESDFLVAYSTPDGKYEMNAYL